VQHVTFFYVFILHLGLPPTLKEAKATIYDTDIEELKY